MRSILPEPASNLNNIDPVLAALSIADIKAEIRYLEGQAEIQREELRDLEEAHQRRPYRREFMATMRRGYKQSLDELHSQIDAVRAMLN